MKLFYNLDSQFLCDDSGIELKTSRPLLWYANRASLELHFLDFSGAAVSLTDFASFRSAVDVDKASATTPCTRSASFTAADSASGIVLDTVDTATTQFLAAVDGKTDAVQGWYELWGMKSDASEVKLAEFRIYLAADVDAAGGELPELTDPGVYNRAQTDALLAGKAASVHTHTIADTTGLQAALNAKAAADHKHALSSLTDVAVGAQTAGQSLVWDVANSKWIPGTVSGSGVTSDDVSSAISTHNTASDAHASLFAQKAPAVSTVSASSTVTSAYVADYTAAQVHCIVLTTSTACTLTVTNLPAGAAIVIRVDNTAAGSLVFGSDTVVATTDTGIQWVLIANVTGTPEIVK